MPTIRLSWWDARRKMAELVPDLWFWHGSPGDEALIRALRRGKIRCQHRGCGDHLGGEEIQIEDVLKDLRTLTLFSDLAIVEFETTEVQQQFSVIGAGSVRMLSPLTMKLKRTGTLWIRCPELIWQDLYNDLKLWELPNETSCDRAPPKHRSSGRNKGRIPHPMWE